jgi:hypothetical protein
MIGDQVATGENQAQREKHRTEATEVTEGMAVGSQEFDRRETLTFCAVLTPDAQCSLRNFRLRSDPPSVTSVRCFPLRMVLARAPNASTMALSSLIFQLDPEKASLNEEREPRCRGL